MGLTRSHLQGLPALDRLSYNTKPTNVQCARGPNGSVDPAHKGAHSLQIRMIASP